MYENYIDQLKPKPVFNKKWYEGTDKYSDGSVEDTIIRLIAENEPEDYSQSIADNFGWPTFCHLTSIRKNILNWYPFDEDASVLEIGCGMGALTCVLCEKCKRVTAVEMSEKRATATLLRCREYDNLEIIVGNLNDIEFGEKFDYITLIGVFEYQGTYTDTDNPYHDFLVKIRSLLKPDGILLIAIENQYGFKYWCGAREDHTAIPFDGINGYKYSSRDVRTFSKDALEKLIKGSGFEETFFYYPMPDYKLPSVIYSEKHLPTKGNMQNLQPYYTPDSATLVADEKKLYQDVIDNHVFEFMANSFLVECSQGKTGEHITFAVMSNARQTEYQIGTRFVENKKVEKFPLNKLSISHIKNIKENEDYLRNHNIKTLKSDFENELYKTDYIQAPLLEDILLEAIDKGDKQDFIVNFKKLQSEILRSSEHVDWKDNILYTFGLEIEPDEKRYGPILEIGNIDMIARNAFVIDGEFVWFDMEWKLENVPAAYVVYRAVKEFYSSYQNVEKVCPLRELLTQLGILSIWDDCSLLERLFFGVVIDQNCLLEMRHFHVEELDKTVASNINKLMK